MAQGFSFYDRLYLSLFYALKLRRYDLPEQRVGWQSRRNQEARFEALTGVGDLLGRRVLDLGSGLGCLYGYLRERGWRGDYTGFDLLGPMTREARRRFPEARFETRDILADPPREQWDYALVSGVFNHRVKDNWAWTAAMVGALRGLAAKGVAFNLLSSELGEWDPELFYAHPRELERRAADWSGGNYRLVTGYLPGDVTVYLYP
ncbi:MAG TPA: class I SAM-dependent methyltransferase [bacterium]|nr:class I SAM-dependent methyltransferase [bacterium]